MPTDLWPPLSLVRSALEDVGTHTTRPPAAECHPSFPARPGNGGPPQPPMHDLLLPLSELARRREAVRQQAFGVQWEPGRLIGIPFDGLLLGVLLDRRLHDGRWQGWMAAGEADWAGAFDVLLEPDDEPFEPAFGLVQTWNPVTLTQRAAEGARVLGAVSVSRLAALRAVADESAGPATRDIAAWPGRIALRSVDNTFTVLTGTPLSAADDPRSAYQALYRAVGEKLTLGLRPEVPVEPMAGRPAAPVRTAWERARRWWSSGGAWRPAFAVLALWVLVQNAEFSRIGDAPDDGVRFRGSAQQVPAASVLTVRWKPEASMDEVALLLRSISADIDRGPDALGVWRLRLSPVDVESATRVLRSSALVADVAPDSK